MGSHSNICTFAFHFTGPPEELPNKLTISISSDCGVDTKAETKTVEVPSDVFSDHRLLLEFSKLGPFTFNLPKAFFEQNHQRNVEEFLELIRSCLLLLPEAGHSDSFTVSERNNNTQDDLSAKSAPHGSEDKDGYGNVSSLYAYSYMVTPNESI